MTALLAGARLRVPTPGNALNRELLPLTANCYRRHHYWNSIIRASPIAWGV